MILIGIVYGALNGNMEAVSNSALDSAKEAITLCISMLGVMALWCGIMEIAEKSGIIKSLTGKLQSFIGFMFPGIPKGHKSREYIATNMIANILGLGWAATPAGLLAMKSLKELNNNRPVASNEMCTFLIINISSLQLIPVNIIAYRSQYGSTNPASIVGATIIATSISTFVGIVFAKIMDRRRKL